jgi:hypothetical protein
LLLGVVLSFHQSYLPAGRGALRRVNDRPGNAAHRESTEFGITSAAVRRFAGRFPVEQIDAGSTLFTLFISLLVIGLALGTVVWVAARPLSAILGFAETLGPVQGSELIRMCAVWVAVSLASLIPGIVARAAQALFLISIVQTLATMVLWFGAWRCKRGRAANQRR